MKKDSKYFSISTQEKTYLADICIMKGCNVKNIIFSFFLSMVWLLHTQNFMFTKPALHVFCKKLHKYLTKLIKPNIHSKVLRVLQHLIFFSIFRSKLNMELCFTFLNFRFFYFHCLTHSAMLNMTVGLFSLVHVIK